MTIVFLDVCKKKLLYLGLDPTRYQTDKIIVHYPIITIEKRPLEGELEAAFQKLSEASVVVVTSRVAASIFFEYCYKMEIRERELHKKLYIAVGKGTAEKLPHAIVTQEEQGEGVIALLEKLPYLQTRTFFFPHSSASRPIIANYLKEKAFSFTDLILYDPKPTPLPLPYNLEEFDEIVFTSPSTVHAFFEKKYTLFSHLELTTIGPITHNVLLKYFKR